MANPNAAILALAVARQAAEFDAPAAVVYAHLLEDLPPDLVVLACEVLSREPRPEFGSVMPSVGDIRQRVFRLERDEKLRAKALPEADPRTMVRCATCHDTGWREFKCDGTGQCGRTRAGFTDGVFWGKCVYPHPYVERCICHRSGVN